MLASKCLGCGGDISQPSLSPKEIQVSRDALILARGNPGREIADRWGENPTGGVCLCHSCYRRYELFVEALLGLQVEKKEFKVSENAGPIYPHFDGKDTAFRMVAWVGGTRISSETRIDSTYDREEFLIRGEKIFPLWCVRLGEDEFVTWTYYP